jgi:hypothetical protein
MIRTLSAATALWLVATVPSLPALGFAKPSAATSPDPASSPSRRAPHEPIRSLETSSSPDANPPQPVPPLPEVDRKEPDPFALPDTRAPRCAKSAVLVVQRVASYRKGPLGLARAWEDPEWRCLRVGEKFGPPSISVDGEPERVFTVRRKLDAKTLEVAFGKGWVVAGEPIAYASRENPKRVSTKGVCFRMAIFDGGGDLCLRVVAASPSASRK